MNWHPTIHFTLGGAHSLDLTPAPSKLPTKMAKVFLSHSTADDRYVSQVQAFLRAMIDADVFNDIFSIPAGADFSEEIKRGIAECERLVVIVSRDSIRSAWVQREVEYARSLGKPVIPVRIDNSDIPPFLATVNVLDFRPGRGNKLHFNTRSLPATYTGKLYGRDAELRQLFLDLDDPKVRVVAFDAMGGTGKTALLFHFVQQLKAGGWGRLQSVFIWSFYSQGSSEDKQSHAADFFKAAFAHFHPDGKAAEVPKDPREQGEVLARLIAEQATLLVLDGLEPLQYAASGSGGAYQYGGIKDPGVKLLLAQLADHGTGLTIVTTRIQLRELEGNSSFRRHHLDQLPTEAAIELLRDLGIEKTAFPETLPAPVRKDFVAAIDDLKHHALSLNLAARLVADHHQGQIRAFADVIPRLHDAAENEIHENQRSPFRVIRALEAGLFRVLHGRLQRMSAAEAITDSPAASQLCLLYFLGLFDRPASLEHLPVVYDASQDLRDAVPMLPEDKAEYLRAVETAAAERDAILHDPQTTDDARLEARHRFEDTFYDLSFRYWLPPVFARFDPRPESDNRHVTNALTQLSQQNLVSKARLKTGEGSQAEWEELPPGEWFQHHVDCHPLIREYFAFQLRTRYGEAFEAAHGRLYDHFRFEGLPEEFREPNSYGLTAFAAAFPQVRDELSNVVDTGTWPDDWKGVLPPSISYPDWWKLRAAAALLDQPVFQTALKKFLPEDAAGMEPLFAAITHGCLARRHDECFWEVYLPRVARGNEKFATSKLGLYGQNLAALASFFELPFRTPHSALKPSDQALVL